MAEAAFLQVFRTVRAILDRIDQGASFCEDRGFGWGLDNEEREGSAIVLAAFADHPRLAELLPARAAVIVQGGPLADADAYGECEAAYARLIKPTQS